MRMRVGLLAIAVGAACHPAAPARKLARPGQSGMDSLTDEGGGWLARLSISYRRDETDDVEPAPADGTDNSDGNLGGDAYGGRSYPSWRAPTYATQPNRVPDYATSGSLRGVVEGRITWGGVAAMKLPTTCGLIENPSLRVGADRGIGGTLVYIAKVTTGRLASPASLNKPPIVGGEVFKRGCAIVPGAQIAAPGPIRLEIHADTAAKIMVTPASGEPTTLALEDASSRSISLAEGVNRIEGVGLVPAWVVVTNSPYFAITDDAGKFRIPELAAGTYDLTIWHAPIVTSTGTALAYGAPLIVHRTIVVSDARIARADAVLR